MPDLAALVAMLGLAAKDRSQLVLENVAHRHQLAVYMRGLWRRNITDCSSAASTTLCGHTAR